MSSGANRQALILSRRNTDGGLSLRYLPISGLRQDASGRLQFKRIDWQAGLPLQIFEDPNLIIPTSDRTAWLNEWHTDTEWLNALHKTHYSNGLIGLQVVNFAEVVSEPVLGDDVLNSITKLDDVSNGKRVWSRLQGEFWTEFDGELKAKQDVERDFRRGGDRYGGGTQRHPERHRRDQGVLHARGQRALSDRDPRRARGPDPRARQ